MKTTQTVEVDQVTPELVAKSVNQIIDEYCTAQIKLNANHPTGKLLWQTLARVVAGGGKRMRPYLVALVHEAYGGKASQEVLQVGAAWEMLHQSLLIHDDIIDRDYIRHGKLNVAGEYQAVYKKYHVPEPDLSHYADSAAILAGDLALSSAYQLILKSDCTAEQKAKVFEILEQAINDVAAGELQDTESVMEPIGVTNSLMIAELKTGSYSFVGPLQTGAAMAGADAKSLEQLRQLGISIGIAFQLKDDLLGLFGDTKHTGKSNNGDVREGKRTLLLNYAFEAANETQRQLIRKVIGNPAASDKQIDHFRSIVVETGAKQKIEDLVADYASKAQTIVEQMTFTDKQFVAKWNVFTEFILKREN